MKIIEKIRNINFKENKILIYISLALVTILADGGYLFFECMSSTDEFSSIASIMTLLGVDWSGISSGSTYHGFGGIIYLFFILKLIPTINIYKCVLIGCLTLRIACLIISYEIAKNILQNNSLKSFGLAIVCNIGALQPDTSAALSALTEVPITLITLCFSYLIYLAFKKEKMRAGFVILAAMIAGFASSIHSRILIMYVAVLLCIAIMSVVNKKIYKSLFIAAIFFVAAYLLTKVLVDFVNQSVYLTYNSTELSTSTSNILKNKIGIYMAKLLNPQLCLVILKTLLAQLGNYTILSLGFIWIILFSNVAFVISIIKKIKNDSCTKEEKMQFIFCLFGLMNFIGMIVSISISSTGAVMNENYRWYSYLRYSLPYSWIVVLVGLSKLDFRKYSVTAIWIVMLTLPLLFTKYLTVVICKELDDSGYAMNFNMFNRIFYISNEKSINYYSRMAVIILVVLALVCFITLKTRKSLYLYIVYVVYSILINVSIFSYFYERDMLMRESIDASIEYIENNSETINNKIYLYGSTKYKYNLQLKCVNVAFFDVNDISSIKEEDYILMSNQKIEEALNLQEIELDNNEYVYYCTKEGK